MVTCRFIGRLGNNMFQIAAVVGHAERYGLKWHAPIENKESPRFYEFFPKIPTSRGSGPIYNCHDPTMFNYIPIPGGSACLTGFFQSEKYFINVKDQIRELFNLNYQTGYEDYVSIHVRRGDYVRHSAHFPPVTLDYINHGMSHFKGRKMLIFSDDIEWCQNNIQGGEYPNGNEFEDLSLMASCGDHIIANSTFSWWGAWLGNNPDRKVISPHNTSWFGKANGVKGPLPDLLPEGWIKIKFR